MRQNVKLIIVFLAASLFLASCAQVNQFYRGKQVKDLDVIDLRIADGKDVSWQTFDLELVFDYELENDSLKITGVGQLGRHYRALYSRLGHLYVYLFLLDENNVVLETFVVPTLSMHHPEDQFLIDEILPLEQGVVGFSFGYSGVAYESEDSKSAFMPLFNRIPFEKHPD